jgi:RNA polymerase sigma-70 factor (ECF subfamily)
VTRTVAPDRGGLTALRLLVDVARRPAVPVLVMAATGTSSARPGTGRARGKALVTSGPAGDHDGGSGPDAEQRRVLALVELAQRGDSEAFGQVYDLYVDSVYRYVYYRLGSHQLAEDLTSETFLRALRRIDSFTWQGRDIGAWFVTIARNLVTDHFKSSRFRLEVTTAEMLDRDRADDGIEDTVVERMQHVELLKAVRQLRHDQQECIVLRFLQGLTVAETAEVMGRSDGAVKQLQLRAVRALAGLLPGQGEVAAGRAAS